MYKRIELPPTLFSLDIFVSDDIEFITTKCSELYGKSKEFYKEELSFDIVWEQKDIEDKTRILLILQNYDIDIIVHEIVHVIFRLSDLTHIEVNTDSQEWVALMSEYIYKEIIKTK